MPHVRKARAGSDSHGHIWPEDGAVVEVPGEVATSLLAIPDGGFTLAAEPEPEPEPEPVEEPAPEPDNPVDEAPKPRQPRGRKPKPPAGTPVEE